MDYHLFLSLEVLDKQSSRWAVFQKHIRTQHSLRQGMVFLIDDWLDCEILDDGQYCEDNDEVTLALSAEIICDDKFAEARHRLREYGWHFYDGFWDSEVLLP